jgi:hypothetical protein
MCHQLSNVDKIELHTLFDGSVLICKNSFHLGLGQVGYSVIYLSWQTD